MNKHFELGELITRPTLDYVEELEAKVQKIRERSINGIIIKFINKQIINLESQEKLGNVGQQWLDEYKELKEILGDEKS